MDNRILVNEDSLDIDDDLEDQPPQDQSINAEPDVPISVKNASYTEEQCNKRWELNYHEAAIYLQEGENNDKFINHPKSQEALPAYLITHNTWFYLLHLFAALLLLLLAIIENPYVEPFRVFVGIHASLELFGLLIIGVELAMRMRWLGPKNFFKHIRTMIKLTTLIIMFAEAIAVLIRRSSHFRVTRALRPIFLVDSYYCRGIRRFIRQIFQSMPPILDMLVLLFFFMLIFSILGFYLFSGVPNDTYFQSIEQSFISLFVLLTTANFPDVMLPAYNNSRWSAIFFIIYLSLELYFLMNLFLAVVYDSFSNMEKQKLKKLWLHKREACQLAFKLLVSRRNARFISVTHFCGLMKFYRPKSSKLDLYLSFKALNESKSGLLNQAEFYRVYEVARVQWKKKNMSDLWSASFLYPLNKVFRGLHWFVTIRWFQYGMYVVIICNFAAILGETITVSIARNDGESEIPIEDQFAVTWYSITFICIYVVEILLKVLALGPKKYFTSGWNIFDFSVTLAALVGTLLELADSTFYYIVVLRPFRLLTLFKLKRSYRDVFGTLFILLSRLVSIALVLVILYYSFAIIGMELFAKYDMRNCCINSSVESYYAYDNNTGQGGYYYLNTFDNILISGVTLFELTVVNNWYIIMEGYAAASSQWSRIYFMLFYLITMIVMTVVVAFILEAFLFRIQYRNKMHGEDMDDHAVFKMEIALNQDELRMCNITDIPFTWLHKSTGQHVNELSWFCGERLRGKDDFSMKMYKDEVQEWLNEEEAKRRRQSAELQDLSNSRTSLNGAALEPRLRLSSEPFTPSSFDTF